MKTSSEQAWEVRIENWCLQTRCVSNINPRAFSLLPACYPSLPGQDYCQKPI